MITVICLVLLAYIVGVVFAGFVVYLLNNPWNKFFQKITGDFSIDPACIFYSWGMFLIFLIFFIFMGFISAIAGIRKIMSAVDGFLNHIKNLKIFAHLHSKVEQLLKFLDKP